MGKRVEGKKKKKGLKANVTSKFGSKRKLSRMGKKVKAGTMGPNTEFITRSNALKRLQITLKDFRRLCILKGVYPRVPDKAPKGADKVYYDIKDIAYIQHEPLLAKFRQFKAFMKKIRRAAGRKEFEDARRKDELKPDMRLDHLVKERYPRFIDALRDIDDALCMVHLFASLPSQGRVTAEKTKSCQQLALQWQYYIARSKTLKKVFVSVKGVYFQAEILGEAITWLTPHQFTQAFPKDVDFRVMLTFLDFYEVYLRFVMFKLYNLLGVQYPPVIDKALMDSGCYLLAVRSSQNDAAVPQKLQLLDQVREEIPSKAVSKKSAAASLAKISSLEDKFESILEKSQRDGDEDDDESIVDVSAPLSNAFSDLNDAGDYDGDEEEMKKFSGSSAEKDLMLFRNFKIFVGREVPLQWLQLSCVSFGAQVGWQGKGSPFDESDSGITHQIIDRPMQGVSQSGRDYIQPQWVFDCINAKMLLPIHKYKPGVSLPPHLSPFVDDDKEGYLPKYREELNKLQSVVQAQSEDNHSVDADDSPKELEIRKPKKSSDGKTASQKKKVEELDSENVTTANKKGPKAIVYEPRQTIVSEVSYTTTFSKFYYTFAFLFVFVCVCTVHTTRHFFPILFYCP